MEFNPLIGPEMVYENLFDCAYSGEAFMAALEASLLVGKCSSLPLQFPGDLSTPWNMEQASTVFPPNALHDPWISVDCSIPDYHIQPDFGEQGFDGYFNSDILEWDASIISCNEGITEDPNGGAVSENRLASKSKSSAIGFDEISKYFYMTITDAAKEMKVGLTVLKKRCRELGIARWPHRKMKSLKSLIQSIQEIRGLDEASQKEIMTLEENRRRMERMPQLELSASTKKLRQTCFKANYKKRRAMRNRYLDVHEAMNF